MGRAFSYIAPPTRARRRGFYDPPTNRFTALTQDGKRITTHFRPDNQERYVRACWSRRTDDPPRGPRPTALRGHAGRACSASLADKGLPPATGGPSSSRRRGRPSRGAWRASAATSSPAAGRSTAVAGLGRRAPGDGDYTFDRWWKVARPAREFEQDGEYQGAGAPGTGTGSEG